MVEGRDLRDDCYITRENMRERTEEWLREVEYYCGAKKRFKLNPGSSALLVIDMQDYFVHERGRAYLPAVEAVLPNIVRLIESYRERGLPVIFTRHAHRDSDDPGILGRWWSEVIRESDEFSLISDKLKPRDDEVIIKKDRYCAFKGTGLDALLREMDVESVVVTGVMTHLCCETTAREAFMRDYEVYFVVDGTATSNEEIHISSLRTLSDGFAVPVSTEEIIEVFKS